MPRDKVDNDRNRTCSTGLHFCSKTYLPAFGGSSGYRVMIVKVSPEDVVAIPSDYKNAKGRACKYEVVGEISHDKAQTKVWPALVLDHGSPTPAVVLEDQTEVKKPYAGVNIDTKELGSLNAKHFINALAKHGSMAAWARSKNLPTSTVRGWKAQFVKLGVKF